MTMSLNELNDHFAIPNIVRFEPGAGGRTVCHITNRYADASIALHGGHVLSYTPKDQHDLLWLSSESSFEQGEPIRGGIPVCWPWFGAHPEDESLPAHGFARRCRWEALGCETLPTGDTQLNLILRDNECTRHCWDYGFELELIVTVGKQLRVDLVMRNTGDTAFTCTAALHTYFDIGDITTTTVDGLDGHTYIDTVGGANTRHQQQGPVTFGGEVDRVYLDTTDTCIIHAPARHRRIEVAKQGSRTTVVWNPWIAKAQRMPDFGDDEYTEMLCVETTNAADDLVELAPGASHTTTAILEAQPGD